MCLFLQNGACGSSKVNIGSSKLNIGSSKVTTLPRISFTCNCGVMLCALCHCVVGHYMPVMIRHSCCVK